MTMEMTLNDFKPLRDFVHEKTGIFLSEEKMYFLESRVQSRCREIACDSVPDYYRILKHSPGDEELKALIEILTVNETYFFRDWPQLKACAYEALPMILERKKAAGESLLRIWSAGCSSGEEPYTLAMLAAEAAQGFKVQVVGTDINQRVLEICRRGIYSGRSLKDVPPLFLSKYFTQKDGAYEVIPSIRQTVDFLTLNLIDKSRMRLMYNFDLILCRNVVIYFDNPIVKQIIGCFYDALKKGGFIFLGSAESMHMFSGAFKLVKLKEVFGYMKE